MIGKILQKIKRILKPWFTFGKKTHFNQIWNHINMKKYRQIIVFENKFGFSSIMKQRPQQVALHFKEDVLFIYHSNKDQYDNALSYTFLKENVLLINLDLYRKPLLQKLKKQRNKYLMIYSTNYIGEKRIHQYLTNQFEIIYEYVDNIDPLLNGEKLAKKLQQQFNYLLEQDTLHIITTATKLYDNVKKIKANAHVKLITNGCDYDHFKVRKYYVPKDMIEIKHNHKPIVGYYGAIASWFDYELIRKIAQTGKYNVVLIGMDYDDTLEKENILTLENVYYLGQKEYDVLPCYLSHFDICMIPFIINDITLSTSPVKVFEYMASGKPIVTTALPECMKYRSVLPAQDHEEFILYLEKAFQLKEDKEYLSMLKKEAMENRWESKCDEIIRFIKEK